MKRSISLLLTFLFIASYSFADEGKKYGKDITLNEKTNVSAILEKAEDFVGKKVLIEGIILNVCAKAGCWIEVASDKEQESIIIKVEDGEIIFPMEAKGKKALVEGEVFSIVVKPDACVGEGGEKKCGEKAEGNKDHTDCKDKKDTKQETKVTKKYMIKGIGAVIS
jgi:hypothetical protein